MTATFDAETLAQLRTTEEVRILAGEPPGKPVIIWVVVDADTVFIRSFRGPNAVWYRAAVATGRATLEIGERTLAVRVIAAPDQPSIERTSRQFLTKYSASPYAQKMVVPEILMTTLRLEPL